MNEERSGPKAAGRGLRCSFGGLLVWSLYLVAYKPTAARSPKVVGN